MDPEQSAKVAAFFDFLPRNLEKIENASDKCSFIQVGIIQKGKSLEAIKGDITAFERRILEEKFKIESRLAREDLVFLDRALPDSIAYYKLCGIDPFEAVEKSRIYQYKTVFLFERLLFEKDPVRSESEDTAARLENLLAEGYRVLGYRPVGVPLMPIGERADFIVNYK